MHVFLVGIGIVSLGSFRESTLMTDYHSGWDGGGGHSFVTIWSIGKWTVLRSFITCTVHCPCEIYNVTEVKFIFLILDMVRQ